MWGSGKLGLPVSVVIALKGHKIFVYDSDKSKLEKYRAGIPETGSYEPSLKEKLGEVLNSGNITFCDTPEQLWNNVPSIIFIAVPTPSKDDNSFDTSYVKQVLNTIKTLPLTPGYTPVISIISTVLPMTTRTDFAPLTRYPLVYNPFFIAMGTVVEDYRKPEFVLLGYENMGATTNKERTTMTEFYQKIYADEALEPPFLHMTWEEAECTKVLYNTIIGFKIVIGNAIMEMCHHIPYANCDTVVDAFKHATKRIVGAKYLKGGMGDGGECHPRDNRALSFLSEKLGLSTNPFNFIMEARNYQSGWLAYLLTQYKLPVVILGKRFKANTNLITDSASILVADIVMRMGEDVYFHDPLLGLEYYPDKPHVFLAAIDESWVCHYPYPNGSIVLDVWRRFSPSDVENLTVRGVKYVPVGRNVQ